MAKNGTNRGGRRVRAGAKPDALSEKVAKGRPATRLEDPLNEPFDFEGSDIGDGAVQISCMGSNDGRMSTDARIQQTNQQIQADWLSLGANNSTEAYQKISEYADLDSAVLGWFLAGYVKEEIRLTACRKLAEFIYE